MATKTIKEAISELESGSIFKLEDLGIDREKQLAAAQALSRMVKKGEIERLSPGHYHKPKMTLFGSVGPAVEELVKDLLFNGTEPIGYLTGYYAFNLLGLTTPHSTIIEIGKQEVRKKTKRGIYEIRFVKQRNEITDNTIPLLRILDCLKWIKRIPDASVLQSYNRLQEIVSTLTLHEKIEITSLSFNYNPSTRALLGSIIRNPEQEALLLNSLNPLTQYEIGLNTENLSEKWNIK